MVFRAGPGTELGAPASRAKRLTQMLDELRHGDAYMNMRHTGKTGMRREWGTGTEVLSTSSVFAQESFEPEHRELRECQREMSQQPRLITSCHVRMPTGFTE